MHSGFVWWYYKIVYCLTSVENDVFLLSAEGTTRVNWVWYSHKIEIQFSAYAPFYIFHDKCIEKQHIDKFKTSLKVIDSSGAMKNYKLWKIVIFYFRVMLVENLYFSCSFPHSSEMIFNTVLSLEMYYFQCMYYKSFSIAYQTVFAHCPHS